VVVNLNNHLVHLIDWIVFCLDNYIKFNTMEEYIAAILTPVFILGVFVFSYLTHNKKG